MINGEVKKARAEINRIMFVVLLSVLSLMNLISLRHIATKYIYLFQSFVRQLCRNVIRTFFLFQSFALSGQHKLHS